MEPRRLLVTDAAEPPLRQAAVWLIMTLGRRNMKQKAQQVILIALLAILSPCAVLALLLVFAALSSAASGKNITAAVITVPWLLIGASLPILSFLLLRRIYKLGYDKRTRRLIFWFYCGVMLYCGIWAASPVASKGDMVYALFSPIQFIFVTILLATPAVFTMCTKEEIRNEK